jgi:F-type H+-transporting ATPase subunit delta
VRTAEALTEDQLSSIVNRLKQTLGLDVLVKTQVDPDLIGGLVVRVGDTVFDGSVANQLVHLRKTAVDKAVQEIRQSLDRFVLAE